MLPRIPRRKATWTRQSLHISDIRCPEDGEKIAKTRPTSEGTFGGGRLRNALGTPGGVAVSARLSVDPGAAGMRMVAPLRSAQIAAFMEAGA
jgi:hypothetical protein